MESEVYIAYLRARSDGENKITKIQRLFEAARFGEIVEEGDLTAIKVHFGERGSDAYINPVFIRTIVDAIKKCGGKPFITDTGTLYKGSRSNAVDHLVTAIEHGFDYSVVAAPLIISGGLWGSHSTDVIIKKKHFKKVKIATDIVEADSMFVLSHFKAHMLTGFGGAIKNLAMGCTASSGKKEQHRAHALVHPELCEGCGRCVAVCPEEALSLDNNVSHIDLARCTGCGECMTVCQSNAIEFDWTVDLPPFVERMTEYALGAIANKKQKNGFYNFLTTITPDCDCVPWSDAPVVPDIGILASRDPVALDHASFDLVNSQLGLRESALQRNHEHGKDKFRGIWEHTDGYLQIQYGEEIGLGSASYRLREI